MAQLTKTERMIDEAIVAHTGDRERVAVLERAKRFKRSWIELGEVLARVREDESWRRWGFDSFDDYCGKELRLRRATVDKLCASFGFLRQNAPRLVRDEQPGELQPVPSWQAVDFVARAEKRGDVDEDTLDEMKRAVFEEAVPLPQLSRQYREVAFPLSDDQRRARVRTQILATARKLAELVTDDSAEIPRKLAERVEEMSGALSQALAS